MKKEFENMSDEKIIEIIKREYMTGKDDLCGCETMPIEQYIKYRLTEIKNSK